ncbi:acetate uptake transporter family protein [Aspergillus saccharolyticus JOP 1030-1]|uniref:GPR/FUN34 family protein n=1 Tax=Aspergillus saccharolyticus JOP 1030-1 TaxID=1450539 RepID=A0A318ZPV6_9EURO|nr:GPR/FUN34 family protein [Aspergillus saccharolyticus JOP 1030-1]PYH49057.1 GPR/FUN34 family protein [Aspergillus saccharolyticus JOP 1030-1]
MSVEQNPNLEKEIGAESESNGAAPIRHEMSAEETARAAARFGYGPMAHVNTAEAQLRPFGGEFQPGLYKSVEGRKFANPAPLGLCAFALTTFVLSAVNMGTRGISAPNIVVGLAFGYGGLVQLLAGMWEMAVGNTFGATALSSYGGFWLSFAIILTPGGFDIESAIESAGGAPMFYNSMGLFLMGWFIFTTIMLFCTLRSTVAFFLLFFFLDLTFLLLGIGYLQRNDTNEVNTPVIKAGGFFGFLAAFAAWYNALAGIADSSNSFFIIPVAHFPWSPTARSRQKTARETV